MIKVLHFVSTPAIWSGVMSVIMNYYRHMDRSKIQFDFLCFIPCKSPEESYEEEIRGLGGQIFWISKPNTPRAFKDLKKVMNKFGAEYTWFHNHEVYLSLFLKPLADHCGIKNFIIHSHATRFSDRPFAALRNRVLCLPIRFMKCEHFACSKAAGNFLYGNCIPTFRSYYVLPNAVEKQKCLFNMEHRDQYRKLLDVEKKYVIGNIGRFVPQKNHRFLVNAFSKILVQIPNACLFLIGDGPLMREIQDLVSSLNIESKVRFLGRRGDIPCLLQAMDLFLLPSLYEGLPMSCLEAQAAGLPCIISDAISSEVCLSPHIQQLSLKDEDLWAEKSLDFKNNMGRFLPDEWRSCPTTLPDIAAEVKKLITYYESHKGMDEISA